MEKIYYSENIKKEVEIREYVKNYVIEKNENSKLKKLKIKLGDFKFVIYLVKKLKNIDGINEVKIIKTKEKINYGSIKINDKVEKFNIDLCFIISYENNNTYYEKAEKLIEKIISNMDYYKKI